MFSEWFCICFLFSLFLFNKHFPELNAEFCCFSLKIIGISSLFKFILNLLCILNIKFKIKAQNKGFITRRFFSWRYLQEQNFKLSNNLHVSKREFEEAQFDEEEAQFYQSN